MGYDKRRAVVLTVVVAIVMGLIIGLGLWLAQALLAGLWA